MELAKRLIEQLENEQLQFQIEHAELLPENANNLQLAIGEVESELSVLRQRRDSARMRGAKLEQRLLSTPEKQSLDVTEANPKLAELEGKKRALDDQIALNIGRYVMTDKHPDLVALRLQVDTLNQEIDRTTKVVITQKHVSNNPKHREFGRADDHRLG